MFTVLKVCKPSYLLGGGREGRETGGEWQHPLKFVFDIKKLGFSFQDCDAIMVQ